MMALSDPKAESDLTWKSSGTYTPDGEQLLDLLLAGTNTSFALLDVDFQIIRVNGRYAKAHGNPEDYFPGKNYFDLYSTDTKPLFEKARESKKVSTISSCPLVTPGLPEQHATYWDRTIVPIPNEQGEITALILTENEVTERVQTEQDLYRTSKIFAAVGNALEHDNRYTEPREILDALLAEVINLTESEYGFIGQAATDNYGQPCIEIQTILDFTCNVQTRGDSIAKAPQQLSQTNPDTSLGKLIRGGEAIIASDPASAALIDGLPAGHPELNSFMGIPFKVGENLKGVIVVANSPDGYDKSLLELLQPLLKCYLQLIHSYADHLGQHKDLTSLEESTALIRDLAVSAIENEHGELIDLINECYEEMTNDSEPEAILWHLEKIYSSVAEHFLHEERLMRNAAYPEEEAHKQAHERLLATLRRNMERFADDPTHDPYVLQKTLAEWFGRHFSTHDQRLNWFFSD